MQSHSYHRLGESENHSNLDIYWKKRTCNRTVERVSSIGSLEGFDHLDNSFANHLYKYHLEESFPNRI